MSVKCPRCHSLVATDAVTDAPPEYCPYCDVPLVAPELGRIESDAKAAAADNEASHDEPQRPAAEADGFDASAAAPAAEDIDTTDTIVTNGSESVLSAAESPEETEAKVHEATVALADIGVEAPLAAADDDTTATAPAPGIAAKKNDAKPRKRGEPSFAHRPARAQVRPAPRGLWAVAAGLALLATAQIVLADRAQLAADARWRPMIVSACGVLHCTIPPWREPAAFAMLGRDVRQHPYMPGALRVDATFRNNARWPQPWPELVLTLSDVDGRALGIRTFSPQEYLGKVTQKEIASGQSAAIRMEIMEPAAGVVSFSFDFR